MEECTEVGFLSLSAYHDGEAGPAEAERIAEHAQTCGECRSTLARLASLSGALQRSSADNTVPARIRDAAARGSSRRDRARWPLAVAVLVACLGVSAVALGVVSKQRATRARVGEEVVMRHLAGFARPEPCDIDSADAKVVSAWLSERAGYPVSVMLPAAAFMVRQGGAPLTVFVPPAGSEAAREAKRLAESTSSCMRGPLGFSICACAAPQPMLAVAEAEPAVVDRAFSRLPWVTR
jgi:predicted anti-sigma-YlaC factor YlaD